MKTMKTCIAFLSLAFVLFTAGCGHAGTNSAEKPQHSPATHTQHVQNNKKTFTLAELKKYDGTNGRPAYIAVKGTVYNVTHAPDWHNGRHKGARAGEDLTAAIEHAPHGTAVLSSVPIVGQLKK